MNERIQELRRKATCVETYTTNDGTIAEGKSVDLEKFAELIVRECAELCLQEANKSVNNVWEQIRARCDAQMILNNFGVE